MWNKDSILKSVLTLTCPKCHEGKLFAKGKLIQPGSLFKMNAHCQHCNQSFEPEPGFYFGAMFVSYAINTALFILSWITLTFFYPEYSLLLLLGILTLVVLLALPLTFRLSRSIWLAVFVPYPTKNFRGKQS
jgi:uncharacterized protein (DUF983 family)